MKPSFALALSHERISLLHRVASGWMPVGAVDTDDPDLPGAMAALRQTALGLEPDGVACKLVIPNSEILYATLQAPGPKAAQRRAQIAQALEGRTPYAVTDLVFDWSGTGAEVQVAVVARETLDEAEAFAVMHGFAPVSLVAIPEPGGFAAEPWFGMTAHAAEVLGPGKKVVRDQDPMRILQRQGGGRSAKAAAAKAGSTEAPAEETTVPVAPALPDPAPEPMPVPVLETPDTDAPAPAEPVAADVPEVATELPEPVSAPTEMTTAEFPASAPEPAAEADLSTGAAALVESPAESAAAPEPPAEPQPAQVADLPTAAPVIEPPATYKSDADETVSAAPGLVSEVPPTEPAPTVAAPSEPPAEADETQSWPGEADQLDDTKALLAASLAPPPLAAETAIASGLQRNLADDPLPPAPAGAILRAVQAARAERVGREDALVATQASVPAAPAPGNGATAKLSEKMQKALSRTAKPSRAKVKIKPAATRPAAAAPAPPLPPSAVQPQVPHPRSEAEAMTVFGRRREPVGGKPRFLGLALTGVLLLILVLIAFWASVFLEPPIEDSADRPAPAPVAALSPEPPPATPPETEIAAVEPAPAPAEEAALPPAPAEPEATTPDTAPPPVAETAPEPEAAPDGAGAGRTVTAEARGIASGLADELTLPLPDALPAIPAPSRMAAAETALSPDDPGPVAVLPEFGALYSFDAEGNIIPTPDGVITPDGVRLVAARPSPLPPPRPETAAPAPEPQVAAPADPAEPSEPPVAEATPAAPAEIAVEAVAPDSYEPDPRFAGDRPRLRPESLVVPPPAPEAPAPGQPPVAVDEGALPDAEPDVIQITTRRPPQRPASVVAEAARLNEAEQANRLAAAAAAAAQAASTAALAATAEATALPDTALSATRRPPARPANFSRAVEAAVAAALAPAPPQVAATARAAPDRTSRGARAGDDLLEDDEPEPTRAAPAIPTRASVARQATVANALNLGRTNLIGVFGTANARYALVRESGGRLVRVKVGDRVDGGRVVAIGQSDLRYQKGSQTLQLRMPRG